MNMLIIFGVAAGCILAGRLWPAMELPRVNAWWGKSHSYQLDSARHHLPCRPDLESLARSRVGLLLCETTSAIGRPPRLSISFRRSLVIGGIGTGMNQPFYGECCTKSTIQPSPGNRYQLLQTSGRDSD
jgi:hypothetical protein